MEAEHFPNESDAGAEAIRWNSGGYSKGKVLGNR
jgi:hypothetical protein